MSVLVAPVDPESGLREEPLPDLSQTLGRRGLLPKKMITGLGRPKPTLLTSGPTWNFWSFHRTGPWPLDSLSLPDEASRNKGLCELPAPVKFISSGSTLTPNFRKVATPEAHL